MEQKVEWAFLNRQAETQLTIAVYPGGEIFRAHFVAILMQESVIIIRSAR
jgi:hypothetical protein